MMKISGTVRISLFSGLMMRCHPPLQLLLDTIQLRYVRILPVEPSHTFSMISCLRSLAISRICRASFRCIALRSILSSVKGMVKRIVEDSPRSVQLQHVVVALRILIGEGEAGKFRVIVGVAALGVSDDHLLARYQTVL